MSRPLCIDLFCGLGGWTEGFLAEDYEVVGFDIEQHVYGEHRYPASLVIQDVRTIHGSQFRSAAAIVASPPCQEFSYMAMPWTRAKQIARALRGEGDFPDGYKGSRTVEELTALFRACFRIQREACEAAGRHIPLVVENVKGAQPWVGPAQWRYGSFYLWGDIPALMPLTLRAQKFNPDGTAHPPGSWFAVADSKERGARAGGDGHKNPGFRFDGRGKSFQSESVERATKSTGGSWFSDGNGAKVTRNDPRDGVKHSATGAAWFDTGPAASGSKSSARKAASARIAKIPFALARHIAHVYRPETEAEDAA